MFLRLEEQILNRNIPSHAVPPFFPGGNQGARKGTKLTKETSAASSFSREGQYILYPFIIWQSRNSPCFFSFNSSFSSVADINLSLESCCSLYSELKIWRVSAYLTKVSKCIQNCKQVKRKKTGPKFRPMKFN